MTTAWIKPPYYTSSTERIVYEPRVIRIERFLRGGWVTVLTSNYGNKAPRGVSYVRKA